MKYGITLFGRDGSSASELPETFEIDGGWELEPILELWYDSNNFFSLEGAMTLLEAEGYVLDEIENDGWYSYVKEDNVYASIVPYYEDGDIE